MDPDPKRFAYPRTAGSHPHPRSKVIRPPMPDGEAERLAALRSHCVLDTPPERAFDDLTELASELCGTPISLVSLVDAHRQWFKSSVGLDATETPREIAFCAHAILDPEEVLVVPDAGSDERFRDNPLVTGDPNIRFYAGAPLVTPDGHALGTLCVIDRVPRDLDEGQIRALRVLARQVVTQLELRRTCSDLGRARDKANDATAAKSEFLANMSHEIRTPMNAVLGMTELLASTGLTAEQDHYVHVFRNAGQSLLGLIDGILDISKVEAGKLEIFEESFDLRHSLETIVELFAVAAHEKELTLVLDIADDCPQTLVGDHNRLRQVLANLLGNAVKFTDRGRIVISAAPCAEDLLFSVQDTGIGIAQEDLSLLFQPFSQVDSSSRRRFGGTGLGLNLAKRLVELMGGQVCAESTPGVGSKFSVVIPMRDRVPASAARPDLLDLRILLVFPDAIERASVRRVLEGLGCDVTDTDDENEASALWHEEEGGRHPFDTLLVDLGASSGSGLGLVREIGKDPDAAERVLVTLPVNCGGESFGICGELELGGHLTKPFRRSDLANALKVIASGDQWTRSSRVADEDTLPTPERTVRILFAEDSPDSRFLVESYLADPAYIVECVSDGESAVERSRDGVYDVILMDLQLPVMDGYTAIRTIREDESARGVGRTPILAVSGNAMPEDRLRCRAAGADEHLAKPISRRTLVEALIPYAGRAPGPLEGIPEEVWAVLPQYVANRRKDLESLRDALRSDDLEVVRVLGHDMKGTGESFGLPSISAIGASLEQAGRTDDMETALVELGRLAMLLDELTSMTSPTDSSSTPT